jgi:hypothetical protein
VSVCGTGAAPLPRGFSCRSGLTRVGLALRRGLPIPPHAWPGRICLPRRATGLDVCSQKDARASPPGPPVGDNGAPRYGTINPLSIAYAQTGLGLGPTNPERIDLAQEPLGFRCVRFVRTRRYSCRHSHFRPLQPPFQGKLNIMVIKNLLGKNLWVKKRNLIPKKVGGKQLDNCKAHSTFFTLFLPMLFVYQSNCIE